MKPKYDPALTPDSMLSRVRRALRGGGVVASAFGAASQAGAAMLRAGGNAVDAACATAWALSVCEPAESGLGGQTTMMIRWPDNRCVVLDGHSCAPAGISRKLISRRNQKRGFGSLVIPSTVKTLSHAQARFGRLGLASTLAPAIELAEHGYALTTLQRHQQRWTARDIRKHPATAALFLGQTGKPYRVGEIFRQPILARTLRRIADVGTEDFYTGEIARIIAADMQQNGGVLTLNDLQAASFPVERQPLEMEYRGRRVLSVPPPGGGAQVLLSLQILKHLCPGVTACWPDEETWRADVIRAVLAVLTERERWPDHPDDVNASLARWMVSAERAERLAEAIRTQRPAPSVRDMTGEEGNTTQLCTTDADGTVVSLTQSIQSVFGAKVACAPLGFVYNNYLSTCPRDSHPYRLGPGCMPQSNAAPTIVVRRSSPGDTKSLAAEKWTTELVLGSAGSRRIASSVTSVISAVIDRGRSLADAVSMPRAHALLSGKLWYEPGAVSTGSRQRLRPVIRSVRELEDLSYKMGAVQAIAWDGDGIPTGVADPRRDGQVAVG